MSCKDHKDLAYCEKVNRRAPLSFCYFCNENEAWRREDMEVLRRKYRNPLLQSQKEDSRLVSIIIPCIKEDFQYLERTVNNLYHNAIGPVEFIIAYDGFLPVQFPMNTQHIIYEPAVGQRVAMNQMVSMSNGKFILRLDAHCAMSEGWDARMKASCGNDRLICTATDRLNIDTWEGEGIDTGVWVFSDNLRLVMRRTWKSIADRAIEEEVMTTMGQGFMIRKDYYDSLGGSDERMGTYGEMGVEWALKTWLTGGKVIMRTDVVCYHFFRPKGMGAIHNNKGRLKSGNILWNDWILGNNGKTKMTFLELLEKFKHHVEWCKDAIISIKMRRMSPYIRGTDTLDEDTQTEMPTLSRSDHNSAVQGKCEN